MHDRLFDADATPRDAPAPAARIVTALGAAEALASRLRRRRHPPRRRRYRSNSRAIWSPLAWDRSTSVARSSSERTYSTTSASSWAISSTVLTQLLGLLRQGAERHRELEHLLDPLQQGHRGAGRRRLGDVVRHRGPEADRRQPGLDAGVLEDAEDAGRSLVAGGAPARSAPRGLGVVGRAGDRGRPGVRRVGQQRAERDDDRHVELAQDLDQLVAEAAPAHVRLDARG